MHAKDFDTPLFVCRWRSGREQIACSYRGGFAGTWSYLLRIYDGVGC